MVYAFNIDKKIKNENTQNFFSLKNSLFRFRPYWEQMKTKKSFFLFFFNTGFTFPFFNCFVATKKSDASLRQQYID